MVSGLGLMGFSIGSRAFDATRQGIQDTLERLATGQRINRAVDDPSGLQAVTKIDADIARLTSEIERYEQETFWLAAREGGLAALSELVVDLEGAIVRAASTGGTSEGELDAIQAEVNGTLDAVLHVLQTSSFKGQALFTETMRDLGTYEQEYTREPEQGPDQGLDEESGNQQGTVAWTLDSLRMGGEFSMTSGNLDDAQALVETVVDTLARRRGAAGARMNQVASFISEKTTELEELTGARSAIADTDFAAETAELVRLQVLEQAQLTTMQIGRQNAGAVLKLIDAAAPKSAGPLL